MRFIGWRVAARLAAAVLLFSCAIPARAYDYPIENRFDATIVGTPREFEAPMPEKIPVRTYKLEPVGVIRPLFWHQAGLQFSVAAQKGRAPLVFLVAGTGAAFDSAKNLVLQRALYGAGFHVINLSSPTRFNFIVNASSTGLPGYLPDDTRDLYAVMERAWAMVRDRVDASEFSVAGYSLGGIGAAFLAQHDEQAGSFRFKRALMINPPVDLYSSVKLLDGYLDDNVRVGTGEASGFMNEVIDSLARAYQPDEGMRIDEDFLYRAYLLNKRAGRPMRYGGANPAAALIGMSFRVSASAMVFTGDAVSHAGYIVPADKHFDRAESLEYYAWASAQIPFSKYVDELLVPALIRKNPGTTREQILHASSLRSIEQYIRGSDKVWALTNADEIILAPGDLDWLRGALGSRIHVYPRGGHCGNLGYKDNVRDTIAVLKGERLATGDAS